MATEAPGLLDQAERHLAEEEDKKALEAAQQALTLFRRSNDEAGIASSCRLVGHVLCYQGKHGEADSFVRGELNRVQASDDKAGEAKLLLALAEINCGKRGPKSRAEALDYAAKAQEKFREVKDTKMEATACLALANIELKGKDHQKGAEQALALAQKAEDMFKGAGDKKGQAAALHTVAAAHIKAKTAKAEIEPGAWIVAAQEAAKLYQEQGLRKLEAWEKVSIAQWTMIDNPRKALRLAEQALKLTREIGSAQEASALGLVVNCHLEIKDTSTAWMRKEASEAVKVAKEGVKRFKSKGDKFGEGQALMALLLAYLAKEDESQVLKVAQQAGGVFRELGDSTSEALVLQLCPQTLLKKSQTDKALQAAEQVIRRSTGFQEKFLALQGMYEVLLKAKDHRNAIAVAKEIQHLAEGAGEKRKEAAARLMLGNVHLLQEDLVEAVTLAREAQAMFHDMDAHKEEAEALRIVAEVHATGRDYEVALRAAGRAKRLLLQAGDMEGAAGTEFLALQIQLLMLVQGRGEVPDAKIDPDFAQDCAEALEFAGEAVALARKSGNKKLLASVFCTVAQLHTAAMQADQAFLAVDEAMSLFREMEDQLNMAGAMLIESDVHLISGNINKALAVVNKALTIFREEGDTQGESIALGIVEHITGPEEELVEEPQWSEEEWQRWQQEQWQAQYGHMGGAEPGQGQAEPQQAHPQETAIVKKQRAPKQDTGEKLSVNNLSQEVIQRRLMEIVRFSVDIDDDEEVDCDKPLMQMGVTSKSAVTLRNALSEELPGLNMPFTLVFDYPNINMMTELILESVPAGGGRRR